MNLTIPQNDLTKGQISFLKCTDPVVLLSGGYGSGKTTGLGLKLLTMKALNPKVPGMLVAPTWRTLWSVTVRRLLTFLALTLPKSHMPKICDRQGECYLDFGDGVPIFLRSANNPDSIDGLDVGYGLGDELRYWPRLSYDVFLGRIRTPCERPQAAFASTPSIGFMSEEFDTGKKGRRLIVSPTRENMHNLAPGFIDNLRQSYSKRLQRAVLEGIFTILEGAVYEAFEPNPKYSPWIIDYTPNVNRKTYLACDPGFRRSAWIWIQEVGPLEWVVFDQLMLDNTSDIDAVRQVNQRGHEIDEIWVDPAADNTQSAFNIDTLRIMRGIKTRSEKPVRYITGHFRRITYGVDKLRTILGDPEEDPNRYPIRIWFSKKLVRQEKKLSRGIVRDLSRYHYPEVKEGRPITDEPVKDGVSDHACDAFRYWAVGMWLTTPLRDLDYKLQGTKPGYKVAA